MLQTNYVDSKMVETKYVNCLTRGPKLDTRQGNEIADTAQGWYQWLRQDRKSVNRYPPINQDSHTSLGIVFRNAVEHGAVKVVAVNDPVRSA